MSDKQGFTIPQAVQYTGIGRTSIYVAMREGRLQARKFGNRTLFLKSELDRFLTHLPNAYEQAA